jgi:hypothetical protein
MEIIIKIVILKTIFQYVFYVKTKSHTILISIHYLMQQLYGKGKNSCSRIEFRSY